MNSQDENKGGAIFYLLIALAIVVCGAVLIAAAGAL